MFIVYGYKTYVRLLGILTVACGHCGNPAAQRLEQAVKKLTLFWIPLFPFSKKTYLTCTFCGITTKVPKEQVEGLLPHATLPGSAQPAAPVEPALAVAPPPTAQDVAGTPYAAAPAAQYGQQPFPSFSSPQYVQPQQPYPPQYPQQQYPQQQYPPQYPQQQYPQQPWTEG